MPFKENTREELKSVVAGENKEERTRDEHDRAPLLYLEYAKLYPFWEHLTESEKEYIEHSCYKKIYEKGMLIHREQENCMGLVSVLNGQLRTYILSSEGREVTLFRVHAGEVCVLWIRLHLMF